MTASGRKTSTPPTTTDGTNRSPGRFTVPQHIGAITYLGLSHIGGSLLNRSNGLYVIIGVLVVAVIGLGAYIFHEERKPQGIEMSIGKNGVSIEQN